MNADFYRNFVKIVECGTLSAASRELLVAQPALSNQVKLFEEVYGAQLFIRNARQMEPTDAGRILYEKAKSIIALEDAAHREIDACVDGAQGTLRIAMTQAFPDVGIVELLRGFHRAYPKIRYELYELNTAQIMDMLKNNLAEVGIVRSSDRLPPYLAEQICIEQKLCACFRRDNPWLSDRAEAIPTGSLQGVPLAISRGFEATLRDIFQRDSVSPVIMSVSTSRTNAMMWAECGAAVAILCNGERENVFDGELACLPLRSDNEITARELLATRAFITVRDRGLSAAAQRFLDFSQANLSNM